MYVYASRASARFTQHVNYLKRVRFVSIIITSTFGVRISFEPSLLESIDKLKPKYVIGGARDKGSQLPGVPKT